MNVGTTRQNICLLVSWRLENFAISISIVSSCCWCLHRGVLQHSHFSFWFALLELMSFCTTGKVKFVIRLQQPSITRFCIQLGQCSWLDSVFLMTLFTCSPGKVLSRAASASNPAFQRSIFFSPNAFFFYLTIQWGYIARVWCSNMDPYRFTVRPCNHLWVLLLLLLISSFRRYSRFRKLMDGHRKSRLPLCPGTLVTCFGRHTDTAAAARTVAQVFTNGWNNCVALQLHSISLLDNVSIR